MRLFGAHVGQRERPAKTIGSGPFVFQAPVQFACYSMQEIMGFKPVALRNFLDRIQTSLRSAQMGDSYGAIQRALWPASFFMIRCAGLLSEQRVDRHHQGNRRKVPMHLSCGG